MDEIASPWLKVVIDPANLIQPADLAHLREMLEHALHYIIESKVQVLSRATEKGKFIAILDEAFDWLGPDVVLAHAKNPPGLNDAFDVDEAETRMRAWTGSDAIGRKRDEFLAKLTTEEGRQEFRLRNTLQLFYQPYLSSLVRAGFRGRLIMHGLKEDDVRPTTPILREMLQSALPQKG